MIVFPATSREERKLVSNFFRGGGCGGGVEIFPELSGERNTRLGRAVEVDEYKSLGCDVRVDFEERVSCWVEASKVHVFGRFVEIACGKVCPSVESAC